MVAESSLPHSQDPSTCSILSRINPTHFLSAYFLKKQLDVT